MGTVTHSDDTVPLTEASFYILLSLAVGAKHGYAIMKDVQFLSHDRVVLSTGTLYGVIKRFLDQQWIERVDEGVHETNGRQQKAYALTDRGRHVLTAEIERLHVMIRAAAGQQIASTI